MSKLSTSKGPWSLTALLPYGIGAGVGAAGNLVLARAVGRAAKEYFTRGAQPGAAGRAFHSDPNDPESADDVIDGEWLGEEILDAEPT